MKINCHIINLERCPEKKERIIERLNKLNINYDFYNAIDGQKITNEYMEENNYSILKKWKDPYHNRSTTLGEIGCSLSHYNVIKLCHESDNDISLILEDDADFSDDFEENLHICLRELQTINDWDYCYLGRKKMNDDIEDKITNNILKPTYSYWTMGSLIHKRGCKKIIESNFLQNIIISDEFIPLISDNSPHTNFRKYFNTSINTYTYIRNIIYPENNAFKSSDTEIPTFLPNIRGVIEDIKDVADIKDIENNDELQIITVATDNNEPLKRFIDSCNNFDLNYKVLGLNEKWLGGDMKLGKGGGMKLNLLKKDLINYNDDQIILFSDSYDVIFLTNEKEIMDKYNNFDCEIVFAGEAVCWPDQSKEYIFQDTNYKYKYINSGGFIGKVSAIKDLLKDDLEDSYDDQLYIHLKYEKEKDKENIKIDYESQIFQTSSFDDMEINYNGNRIINKLYKTNPCHLHANGSMYKKIYFNNLCNYLLKIWNPTYSYMKNKIDNFDKKILIFIYLHKNVNIKSFFQKIFNLNYDKNNISLYIHTKYHNNLNDIIGEELKKYNSFNISQSNNEEMYIREESMQYCKKLNYDYYLNIDSICDINNINIINELISYDKNIICPLFKKNENEHWSNFWGQVNQDGWYEKSFNYFDILNDVHKGCWNVAYINNIYLIKSNILDTISNYYSLNYQVNKGCDMSFCENCRDNNIFLYLCNENNYGYLNMDVNLETNIENISLKDYDKNNILYLKKYFDENFIDSVNNYDNLNIEESIEDVIQFPIVNDLFCKELIELCEKNNNWSEATSDDKRIGYENIPSNDIHLTQLNMHDIWNSLIKKYIAPIVSYRWGSFKTDNLNIGFIVKYDNNFKSLESHHDSSSYTINICLNDDYEGGEINFIKKNKKFRNSKKGYCIIHPGRITHYHEALPITEGNKYVFVSFVY